MKLVQINNVCGIGSTGKICVGISRILNAQGAENYILYSSGTTEYPQAIKCTEKFPKLQALRSRILGNYGFNSLQTTKQIIVELERIQPDIVHLHNLHAHNCNMEMLMDYFRKNRTKLFWTFHDCWAFTAYCPHFVMAQCNKWKAGCNNCIQARSFSWFFDRSSWLYGKKKRSIRDLDLTIITPSQWLADLVRESFFEQYPVNVIYSGIDTTIFKPRTSDFRKKYHIPENKFMILGVATEWVPRKGADVFVRLTERLDCDKFQIVMVGTDEHIEQLLPPSVISIYHTADQIELAEIYSAADLFVNPTREEVLGLVNLESLACGTPVITYRTGGSPECVDKNTGIVVECDDEDALYQAILEIEAGRTFLPEACRDRALCFSEEEKYAQYYSLYEQAFQK